MGKSSLSCLFENCQGEYGGDIYWSVLQGTRELEKSVVEGT